MSEFIAEAQVLIVPNTAQFAATLRAQLEAAVLKAGPVVVPVTAAPLTAGAAKTVAAETAVATTAIKAESVALEEQAGAARAAAVAQRQLAASEAHAARSHAQATRGIAAETLSLLGLRGATLAASAPFLLGATGAIIFAKSIKAASDETESLNKAVEVFGPSSKVIEDFARTTAASLGISNQEALESAATFGNLFRAIKISEPVAADMSKRLVQLAADLASFNNADPTRVLEGLRSGLVGQARPLRVYGIFLSAARVNQEALIATGKTSIRQLSEAEKAQSRFNIILRDSVIAQGDVERTQGTLANQVRFLQAQLSDLSADIGRVVLPAINGLVGVTLEYVGVVSRADKATQDLASHIPLLGSAGKGSSSGLRDLEKRVAGIYFKAVLLGPAMGAAALGVRLFGKDAHDATDDLTEFDLILGNIDVSLGKLISGFQKVGTRASASTASALQGLETARLKIQTGLTGGGRAAEESNLKKQIEQDKNAVALAKSGTAARKKALEELKADQDDLAQLQAQDASDARDRTQKIKDAADARKKAAEDAARAQKEATDAVIAQFTGRSDALDFALQRVAASGNFKKQIAINKAIISNDQQEITALKRRIQHLHLHGEALKAAKAAIQAANREIQDARDSIIEAQQARKQALQDVIEQRLDLRIQLAQARDNVAAEIKARTARLANITAQLAKLKNAGKKNTLAWLELKVQQAEEIAAIKELKKETDKKKNAQSEAFFAFLQAQQGFAANLLGNLIPGFATRGLVGGGSSTGPAAGAAFSDLGATPGKGVQQTAAIGASQAAGVRPVQVDTTNQLLRQILAAVSGRGRPAPETVHNRRVGSAMMDTLGGIHGA